MSSPARQWWCPECLPVKLFFALVILLPSAFAAPAHELARRDGAGPAAVAIWVPIVGVALFAAASASLYFFYFRKRQSTAPQPPPQQQPATAPLSLATRLRAWSSRPVHIPGTRELTAEELAGGTTRGLLRGRRRRPGSMASTRSTRSLPPYLKEPGEQEVVVYRGQSEDMQNGMLPPVEEQREGTPHLSLDLPRARTRGSSVSANTPLLDDSERERENTPSPEVPLHAPSRLRANSEAGSSVEDPLMENQGERGPAPPYTEATSNSIDSGVAFGNGPVLANSASSPSVYMSRPELVSVDTSNSSRSAFGQTRRPGLFGRSETSLSASGLSHLLWRLHPGQRLNTNGHENASANDLTAVRSSPFDSPRPSEEQQGTRGRPRGATVAGLVSPPSPTVPYRTHRPSHSGSGSTLSAVFRTRSNTSSNAGDPRRGLVSPSAISLHSIGSPLTHTVVRTELTYPRSGPTPEQMKLIASVDSFKRFGVPYGPDAVAYAASASRLNLSLDATPPPVFEEVVQGTPGEAEDRNSVHVLEDSPAVTRVGGHGDGLSPEPDAELGEEAGTDGAVAAPAEATTSPPPPLTAEDVIRTLRQIGQVTQPSPSKPPLPSSPLSPLSAASRATFGTAEETLAIDGDDAGLSTRPIIAITTANGEVVSEGIKTVPSPVTPRNIRPISDELELETPTTTTMMTTTATLLPGPDPVSPVAEHTTEVA